MVSLARIFRAFLGFYILRYIPNTRELPREICPPVDEPLDYKKVEMQLPAATCQILKEKYTFVQKPLLVYFILSILLTVMDLLTVLILMVMASQKEQKVANLMVMFIVTVYFLMDVWLIFYALITRVKMPVSLQTPALKAFFGIGTDLIKELEGQYHVPKAEGQPADPKKF